MAVSARSVEAPIIYSDGTVRPRPGGRDPGRDGFSMGYLKKTHHVENLFKIYEIVHEISIKT